MPLRVKRVYDDSAKTDGVRVLVDRLWPRGLTKEKAAIDLWLKDAAPSTELRKWFHADATPTTPTKDQFAEFKTRYLKELDRSALDSVTELIDAGKTVTLLFASKELEHNHAHILRDVLESR